MSSINPQPTQPVSTNTSLFSIDSPSFDPNVQVIPQADGSVMYVEPLTDVPSDILQATLNIGTLLPGSGYSATTDGTNLDITVQAIPSDAIVSLQSLLPQMQQDIQNNPFQELLSQDTSSSPKGSKDAFMASSPPHTQTKKSTHKTASSLQSKKLTFKSQANHKHH